MRRCWRGPGAHHGAGHDGGQRVPRDPRAVVQGSVRHPPGGRYALRAEGGCPRGRGVREDPHQPGELRRRPQDVRGDQLREPRAVRVGGGTERGDLHPPRGEVQGAQPRHARRHQPWLAVGQDPELLWRHSPRDGGVRVRVRARLPQERLPQLPVLHESQQPLSHGASLPPARCRDVRVRVRLPHPSRGHRSGRGRGRSHEVCHRHRLAVDGRHRRYHPRVPHGGA
mmetsp:Transcript_39009/g.65554  ORF Transcript_39009/g.65554 Transcript_39009/m.65554 type:complete len:226 (-) Transcript_39009:1041-1718(-)